MSNPCGSSRIRIERSDGAVVTAGQRGDLTFLAQLSVDAAVEAAYGVNFDGDEEKIVAHLFKLYAQATA